MTTLAELEVMVSRDLRDASNTAWPLPEVDDLVNQGIDKLGDLYPKEVVDYSLAITSGVSTYALPSTFTRIFKIDIHSSSNSYLYQYPQSIGDTASGWEVHNNVIYLSPMHIPTVSSKLRLFGYGRWLQLSASSATTDMDATGTWAVRSFCKAEAFDALLYDRARFQQWGTDQTNSDVSLTQMLQLAQLAKSKWAREQQRLRRMRK